jgi:hypothetical protein
LTVPLRQRLNFITADPFSSTLDVQNTSIGQSLKNILRDKYTPDVLKGVNFLRGQILRVEKPQKIGTKMAGGFLSQIFGNPDILVRSYKIRIPEIHSLLPVPKTYGLSEVPDYLNKSENKLELISFLQDQTIIDLYPTFLEFNPDDPLNEGIVAGDMVWCLFMNTNTFEEPYMFKKVITTAIAPPLPPSYTEPLQSQPPQANPFAVPPDSTKDISKEPIGYNDKYLLDYSAIIDFMASTKGWPYCWGGFTRDLKANPQLCTTPFATGPNPGVDCAGIIRKAWSFLGLIDPSKRITKSAIDGQFFLESYRAGLLQAVEIGKQLPGDLCVMNRGPGECGHNGLVVTYPDPNDPEKHSFVWCSNGGSKDSGQTPGAFVGQVANSRLPGFRHVFGLSKPKNFGGIQSVIYLRVTPRIMPDILLQKINNNGGKWPFEGAESIKDWPRQFKFPTKIDVCADAVKTAPSKHPLHAGVSTGTV